MILGGRKPTDGGGGVHCMAWGALARVATTGLDWGLVKRAAGLHGMCPQCWLGASEVQRRDALWLEAVEMFADLEAKFRRELDVYGMEAV